MEITNQSLLFFIDWTKKICTTSDIIVVLWNCHSSVIPFPLPSFNPSFPFLTVIPFHPSFHPFFSNSHAFPLLFSFSSLLFSSLICLLFSSFLFYAILFSSPLLSCLLFYSLLIALSLYTGKEVEAFAFFQGYTT